MQMITMDTIIKAIKEETNTFIAVNKREPNTVALGVLQREAIQNYLATCPLTTQQDLDSNLICGLRIEESISMDQVNVYKELW
ncbi:hypothetical protein Slash_69 [Bacillus phage Slash]|uniref:Uncharacterized protein n=3 Tax=Slashvirus TaxID=1921709 RepID=U5Q0F1_9CAUD|nr:hypothetical protein Staley_71 [Bacillus phage Staley]YP_008771971.1 hypothetical protein Slash_69 [Bacillus phage Slash]YP_009203673.1 hypothetical protein CPT_Stahl69 [Bacillus phage Stahl]AGY48358.1 hypothetical protein Slash_69 [Bacillus phage Slash]AGY48754.1 hypothetical protein Staley_71 [Bacillus phage Staley]AKA61497.1 hypothetical protein CPT_Stahl69 [Bacillus phage Stahl]